MVNHNINLGHIILYNLEALLVKKLNKQNLFLISKSLLKKIDV